MHDTVLGFPIHVGRSRALIALDVVPGHRQGGRVAHEVEEVVEPLRWIVLCPLVQLRLDLKYPGTRLNEASVWSIPIQGCFSSYPR